MSQFKHMLGSVLIYVYAKATEIYFYPLISPSDHYRYVQQTVYIMYFLFMNRKETVMFFDPII